jgi:PIN domain nuclease of toxin-antitoxin system
MARISFNLTHSTTIGIIKDPFDRLLVAQAMVEGAVLVSGDPNIAKYAVHVV